MQKWRFLYTLLPSVKKALTKTGHPIPNVTKYIVQGGTDYAECLRQAKNICGFKDHQLIGSFRIK